MNSTRPRSSTRFSSTGASTFLLVALFALSGGCADDVMADGDAGSDAARPGDARVLDAPDATLGCVRAEDGFPRELGLPMPHRDGVFDADIVRDPNTDRLWISYSAVDGAPGRGRVSTHLAYSEDEGQTWCYQGVANASQVVPMAALPAGVGDASGHWSHETSALVYDPGAPPAARWRLMWHRYLHADEAGVAEGRRFAFGWIAQRVAPSAQELLSAPEEKLFSSAAYYASPAITAYNDAAPGGAPLERLDRVPGLETCVVYTEPAMFPLDGALYVALFCARTATDTSIVLLRLAHATDEWSFVGTLMTPADAATIDATYDGFNAADLFAFGGGHRLMLTPTTTARYRGCFVFDIDLPAARVRDETGDGPDVVFALPLGDSADAPFGGACTYVEGSALGLIYSELRVATPAFNLVATGNTALE